MRNKNARDDLFSIVGDSWMLARSAVEFLSELGQLSCLGLVRVAYFPLGMGHRLLFFCCPSYIPSLHPASPLQVGRRGRRSSADEGKATTSNAGSEGDLRRGRTGATGIMKLLSAGKGEKEGMRVVMGWAQKRTEAH